jgi:hypothetical protein
MQLASKNKVSLFILDNWRQLRPRSGRLLEHKKVTILDNWEQLRPRSDRLLKLKLFGFRAAAMQLASKNKVSLFILAGQLKKLKRPPS